MFIVFPLGLVSGFAHFTGASRIITACSHFALK